MIEEDRRYSRQTAFFGIEGQKRIADMRVVVVGVGGLGSHVVQQLAFLGVGHITIIDGDPLDDTNFNRLIGYRDGDRIGMPKVQIVERMVREINPNISVDSIPDTFMSTRGFTALKNGTFAFGCVDNDGARLVLNEFCVAYELMYIDAASDILLDGSQYGGRIVTVLNDSGCLYCAGEIDVDQAGKDLESPEARKDRETIYGIRKDELAGTGPSVVSINGIIASLAVTEFMLHVTEKRRAQFRLNYLGNRGIVTLAKREHEDCYYCKIVRGQRDGANFEKYLPRI